MPKYEIEQYELHAMTYEVEADTEAQALAKLFGGEAEPLDDGSEFIEVADDRGRPAEEYADLAEQLRTLGISVQEAVIPSIRSIVRVEA
jgi:hypothetical protein